MDNNKLQVILSNITNLKEIIDGINSSLDSLSDPNNSYAPSLNVGGCKVFLPKEMFYQDIVIFLNKSLDVALSQLNENSKILNIVLSSLEDK